jgi:ADP-ribose pyrophosphatase YjhB (NUDIX family)
MPNEKQLIHSAVYGILKKSSKFLLMKRFNTGYKDGFFTLPAGHIEKDELPKETMLRELKEETGLFCDIESIIPVHVMYRICDSGRTYVDYYFEILKYNGNPEIKEPEKCDYVDWYDMEDIPENTLPHIKTALNHTKNKVPISEMRE